MKQDTERRGLFVTVEGPDGAGKTTQIERIAGWLDARGVRCLVTRQPGGTPIGVELRRLLLEPGRVIAPRAIYHLFLADRAQHVAEVIRPALEAGTVVLCDRYSLSTVAYQGAAYCDPDVTPLDPDLTILLDVAPEITRARKGGEEDGMERRVKAREVRAAFLQAARVLRPTVQIVSGAGSLVAVQERILDVLEPVIEKWRAGAEGASNA